MIAAIQQLPSGVLVVLVLAAFTALLGVLRVYQVWAAPDPELVRKLFHLFGGLIAVSMIWLFRDIRPVLILSACAAIMFAALRYVPALRRSVGQVLLGVKRDTVGEFCYLAALCLLFWLAKGDKLLYSVPIFVLAIADTAAALIGIEYGKRPLKGWKSSKTIEGSVTFFVAAFFCVHVPLLLWTDTPRLECLMIALNISLMVMMAEIAAWWGLDNIIIPLATYLLLKLFLHLDGVELGGHLAFLLSLSLFIRLWRPYTTLADDALFGAALWGYVAWVMGGWIWIIPPFIVLLAHNTLTEPSPLRRRRVFRFPVVLSHITAGLLWLLIYWPTQEAIYFYPFAAAFAANLAITALVRHRYAYPDMPWAQALAVSTTLGLVVLVPTVLLFGGLTHDSALYLGAGAASVLAALLLFAGTEPRIARYPVGSSRWLRQALVTTATSVLALSPASHLL